jgi:hypothetical protein
MEERPARMIRMHPNGTGEAHRWPFRSLFTFLNELPEDWAYVRNRRRAADENATGRQLKIYYADQQGRGEKRITVKIQPDGFLISIQISRPDLVEWDEWDPVTMKVETMQGKRHWENRQAKPCTMTFWRLLAGYMRGGNAGMNQAAFAAIDAHKFHPTGCPWRAPSFKRAFRSVH